MQTGKKIIAMSEKFEKLYKSRLTPNLTKFAREKETDTIRQNRQENENWRRAITYIEHHIMKYCQVNYSEISRGLNHGTKHGMVVRFVRGSLRGG